MTITERDLIELFRTGTTAELNDAITQLTEQVGQRESERIYTRALKTYDRETEQADDTAFPGQPGSRWRDIDGDMWIHGDDGGMWLMSLRSEPRSPAGLNNCYGPMTRMEGAEQ